MIRETRILGDGPEVRSNKTAAVMLTLYMHYKRLDVYVDEARVARQGCGSRLGPRSHPPSVLPKRSWCGSMASRGLGSRQVMRVEVASRHPGECLEVGGEDIRISSCLGQ